MAASLVLEGVDAAKGLGDGDVEDEVGEGEVVEEEEVVVEERERRW